MKGNNRMIFYLIKLFYEINFDYIWEKIILNCVIIVLVCIMEIFFI